MDCPLSTETCLPRLEDASALSYRGVHVQLRVLVAASIFKHLEDSQEHQVVHLNQAAHFVLIGALLILWNGSLIGALLILWNVNMRLPIEALKVSFLKSNFSTGHGA